MSAGCTETTALNCKLAGCHVISKTEPTFCRTKKPRILIVGAGWGGYRLAQDIEKTRYDVVVVSPRNHFLFTPLLPSTAVGTLEFRAIQEPVRTIPHVEYHQATVDKIDFQNSIVKCTDAFKKDGHCFEMTYDAIVLATGSTTNTFGVPGVENNEQVFFLKQLVDARSIRNRLIDCFERASSPGASLEEIKRLLTFIIVGGGPTSVEFAAELYDFLKSDVTRMYPDLHHHCKVTLVEASGHILGSFNESLVGYVDNLFKTRNVSVITNTAVKIVDGHVARLSDGQEIPFGLMVWSTGVKQVPLIDALSAGDVYKARNGRLFVDGHLRVLAPPLSSSTPTSSSSNATAVLRARAPVFALGDCAGDLAKPLPALAQASTTCTCMFR